MAKAVESGTKRKGDEQVKAAAKGRRKVHPAVRVVFISLILDLLAFTAPLPLFPRLIESFLLDERLTKTSTLLSRTLGFTRSFRTTLLQLGNVPTLAASKNPAFSAEGISHKWDVTLLGGLLGSLFSFAQFIVSPHIGRLSDRHGRKTVLLFTMVGNILSAGLWLFASSFPIYLLSRIVGGLSEGNVQISNSIITDVTTRSTRPGSLALIGMAFALCFTFGPPIGAYFATKPISTAYRTAGTGRQSLGGLELNVYATPAAITLGLLIVETVYLILALPETKGLRDLNKDDSDKKEEERKVEENLPDKPGRTPKERLSRLSTLQLLSFVFLFFFSGAEFTLTFLTFDLLDWTNSQNGRLLGTIGIVSALLQGGFVRRKGRTFGLGRLAKTGVFTATAALTSLAVLPLLVNYENEKLTFELSALEGILKGKVKGGGELTKLALWSSAVLLAYTSATVVNSLTSLATLECDDSSTTANAATSTDVVATTQEKEQLTTGRALGYFRSRGQLGRSLGPIFATSLYWIFGPVVCYSVGAIGMAGVWFLMGNRFGAGGGAGGKVKRS